MFVAGACVGASVSRGVGCLTCDPRCPPSPRAVVSCQAGRHVIGTFDKAANSGQCLCSHAPSHSGDQSGCRFLQSCGLQRPVVIHLSRILASPGARRMAEIAGLQMDTAFAFSGPVSLSYSRDISFRSAPPNCSAKGCHFIVARPLTTNSVGVAVPVGLRP